MNNLADRTDVERLDWAERHPEAAMKSISTWWSLAGRGFREEHFNFRGCIDQAISEQSSSGTGSK